MAKTFNFKGASDLDLTRRKNALLERMHIPTSAMRASYVRQFLTCGKKNCRCQRGRKHGPFHYLVQCLGVGSVRKFLLKTTAQREQARASIAAYAIFQEQLEELSQINAELLRRGELLAESAAESAG
ncbi:MAG: DUF6788 family protein [Verrucomicrobiota bacterium]|jgi:hypothetical protein